jgi:DNA primase
MNEQHIKKFLPLIASKVTDIQNREGWVIASCPFAKTRHSKGVDKHPSFGVKIAPNALSRFHCFSCGSSGELMDIILLLKEELKYDFENLHIHKALEMLAVEDDEAQVNEIIFDDDIKDQHTKVVPFSDDFVDSFMSVTKFKLGIDYLEGRGITMSLIKEMDIRYDALMERIILPIRDWEGRVVGMHGRHITGDYNNPYYVYKEKDKCNPIVWYGEDKINPNEPVVLVESVFDRLKIYPFYTNVLCSLTCGLSKEKVERINILNPFITIADSGKGGKAWLKALTKYLPDHELTHVNIDQYGVGDPGELSNKQVKSLLEAEFLI